MKPRGYQLFLQRCKHELEHCLESYDFWEFVNASQDPIEILKMIRSAINCHDDVKQGTMAFIEQDMRLYTAWQKHDQSPLNYVKQVRAQADVINVHGGASWLSPKALPGSPQPMDDSEWGDSC